MMKRREFLRTATVAASVAMLNRARLGASPLVTPASTPAPGIVEVGSTKQLFLDDLLIAERSRISNFMYRPDKNPKNPIVVADRPWELEGSESGVQQDGQGVMYDAEAQLFKMWYLAPDWSNGAAPWCYAISKNGYDWEKPELGIFDYQGSRRNNLVGVWPKGSDITFTCVTRCPDDPDPQSRFKATGEWENQTATGRTNTRGGMCVAFSPDGLHWTLKEKAAIHHGRNLGDAPTIFGWDPWKKKYVAYPRPGHGLGYEINGMGNHRHKRTIGYAESDDFIHWTPTQIMIAPDLEDRVDYQYGQFVAGLCGNFYVGFLMVHQTHEQTWGVFLLSSRDGFHWNWVDRHTPFLVRGEVGTYDAGYQDMCGPITHDGKIFIYYSGMRGLHGEEYTRRWGPNRSCIAMATMPEDRWLGLLAGPDQGTIVTKPITFTGSHLMVDVEASTPQSVPGPKLGFDECEVRLALVDQSGGRIEGFTSDRSTRLLRSGRQEVSWAGADLRSLEGKFVRIRFEIRNAALYSFQFV